MGPTLNGPFRDLVGLGSWNIVALVLYRETVLDLNEVINIGEWLICGGGRLERFYCTVFTPTLDLGDFYFNESQTQQSLGSLIKHKYAGS